MKTHHISTIFAVLSMLVISSGCSFLGSVAKTPVDQLVTLCKEDKLDDAAKHMRYTGSDSAKKDTSANYATGDANEKRQVEMSCKRFKFMSETTYTVSPERMEQGFYVYDVEVKLREKMDKQLWAFRKSGADYVLVDID